MSQYKFILWCDCAKLLQRFTKVVDAVMQTKPDELLTAKRQREEVDRFIESFHTYCYYYCALFHEMFSCLFRSVLLNSVVNRI